MDYINSTFLKLTQDQYSENKILFDLGVVDSGKVTYFRLTGSTASSATFSSFGPYQSGYKVVGPNTVVFVEFQDYSTLMVLDGKFYAQPKSTPVVSSPIKVIEQGGLPSETYSQQDYSSGDIVMAYRTTSSQGTTTLNDFVIAICTNVDSYEYSGNTIYSYQWVEVAHFPLPSTAQSSLT